MGPTSKVQCLLYPACCLRLRGKLPCQFAGAMERFGPDFGRRITAEGEKFIEPGHSFFEVPPYLPHPAEGRSDAQPYFHFLRTYRQCERCPEVVHLHFLPVIPDDLFVTIGMGFPRLSYLPKV